MGLPCIEELKQLCIFFRDLRIRVTRMTEMTTADEQMIAMSSVLFMLLDFLSSWVVGLWTRLQSISRLVMSLSLKLGGFQHLTTLTVSLLLTAEMMTDLRKLKSQSQVQGLPDMSTDDRDDHDSNDDETDEKPLLLRSTVFKFTLLDPKAWESMYLRFLLDDKIIFSKSR